MNQQKIREIMSKVAARLEVIAQYMRARPRAAITIAAVIVVAIAAYATYVSTVLPRQRMRDVAEAYAASDYARVIDLAGKVFDADPRNVRAALALAAALLQQGTLDGNVSLVLPRVREILLVAEQFSPNHAEVQRQLGYVAILAGDYPTAEKHLNRAVELAPMDSMAHAYLCVFYDAANRIPQAVETCKRAVDLDPYNPFALIASAKVNIEARNLRQARLDAESAVLYASDPVTLAEAHSISAFVAVENFDLAGARASIEKSLSYNPNDFDTLVLSSEVSMRVMAYEILSGKKPQETEDWRLMLERAAQALRVDSSDYYPYLLFMRAYEISGDEVRANRHREIARRLVSEDESLTEAERQEIYLRLDAASNITVTGVRLLAPGETPTTGAIQTYVIQP